MPELPAAMLKARFRGGRNAAAQHCPGAARLHWDGLYGKDRRVISCILAAQRLLQALGEMISSAAVAQW
jgi:hypothetical protein